MLIWREQECARDAGLPIAAMKSGRGFTRAFTGQEPDWYCCGVVTLRGACLPGPGGKTASGGGANQVVLAVLDEVAVVVHGLLRSGGNRPGMLRPAGSTVAGARRGHHTCGPHKTHTMRRVPVLSRAAAYGRLVQLAQARTCLRALGADPGGRCRRGRPVELPGALAWIILVQGRSAACRIAGAR